MAALMQMVERTVGTAGLVAIGAVAARCPEPALRPLGLALGRSVWRLSRRFRDVAHKNLRFVYSAEKDDREIQDLARRVFEHFGRVAVEFFWGYKTSPERIRQIVQFDCSDTIRDALAQGRGAVVITAHFGNWELFGRSVVCNGFPLSVVARDCNDPRQAAFINRMRERGGLKVISKNEPAARMLEALKANEMLALLPDQNAIDKPVFVPFFGKLASCAPGVALLALRARCPILPGFLVRDQQGWHVDQWPPIEIPDAGTMHEKIVRVSADYTKVIEQQIRRHPEQWLWFHDRWRRRPEDEERPA